MYERVRDAHPPCTNFHKSGPTFKAVLDHILYNPAVQVLSLLEMPSDEVLEAEVALPSSVFPSDHLPIQAKLMLDFSLPRVRHDNPTRPLIEKSKKKG